MAIEIPTFELFGLTIDWIGIVAFIFVVGAIIYGLNRTKTKSKEEKKEKKETEKAVATEKLIQRKSRKEKRIEKEMKKNEELIFELENKLQSTSKKLVRIGQVTDEKEQELDQKSELYVQLLNKLLSRISQKEILEKVESRYLINILNSIAQTLIQKIELHKDNEGQIRNVVRLINQTIEHIDYISEKIAVQGEIALEYEKYMENLKMIELNNLTRISQSNKNFIGTLGHSIDTFKYDIHGDAIALKFLIKTIKERENDLSRDYKKLKKFEDWFINRIDEVKNEVQNKADELNQNSASVDDYINTMSVVIKDTYNQLMSITKMASDRSRMLDKYLNDIKSVQLQVNSIIDKGKSIQQKHLYCRKYYDAINEVADQANNDSNVKANKLFSEIKERNINELKEFYKKGEFDNITNQTKKQIEREIKFIEKVKIANQWNKKHIMNSEKYLKNEQDRVVLFVKRINDVINKNKRRIG